MICPFKLSQSHSSFSCGFGKPTRTWFVVIFVNLLFIDFSSTGIIPERNQPKPTFFEIGCKGVYDKTMFARLDRVCDDCYNLFREPQLHGLCRKSCFTDIFFKGCLDVLLIEGEELEQIKKYVKQLHGAEPIIAQEKGDNELDYPSIFPHIRNN